MNSLVIKYLCAYFLFACMVAPIIGRAHYVQKISYRTSINRTLLETLSVMNSIIEPTTAFAEDTNEDIVTAKRAINRLTEQVQERTLSNGLKVFFYHRGSAPVFAGLVAVRLGGVDEPVGKTGISHLLEHLAFKGTPLIGSKDYAREKVLLEEEDLLRSKAAPTTIEAARLAQVTTELEAVSDGESLTEEFTRRGASGLNATTSKELTIYFVNMPRTAFEFWAWIESERLVNPVFRQFYLERDVVLEERRMRYEDDPLGKLYEHLLMTAFSVHPFRDPVIGYERDLLSLTRSDVAYYHSNYYVPSNLAVSVVGDVDPDRDLPILEKYFGRLSGSKARPPHITVEEPQQTAERSVTIQHPSSPSIYIAYKKTAYPHRDDAPISMLEEILAGSVIAPLYEELVKKRRVASSVNVFEAPGNSAPNLFLFSISPRHPHTNNDVLKAFDEVIADFIATGPTAEQVAIAQRGLTVDHLAELRSNMSLARQFASSHLMYGDWKANLDWFAQVLQVSREDVGRVAREYLQPERRTIARLETGTGSVEK